MLLQWDANMTLPKFSYKKLLQSLEQESASQLSTRVQETLRLAYDGHRGQFRDTRDPQSRTPFIVHPVGTARMLDDGKIGRMAVLTEWRGRGVGSALVDALLEVAGDRGRSRVHLAAQTHAIEFYAKQGFQVVGEVFLEAGIPHCAMYCDLPRRHRVRGQ